MHQLSTLRLSLSLSRLPLMPLVKGKSCTGCPLQTQYGISGCSGWGEEQQEEEEEEEEEEEDEEEEEEP